MTNLAQQAIDHTVLFLIGQLLLFVLTLVGALAIGRRFLNQEYPGFVTRVETTMLAHKNELMSEIDAVRRDIVEMRQQFISHQLDAARQARDVLHLDRRVTSVENRLDRNDDTLSMRRRKEDNER